MASGDSKSAPTRNSNQHILEFLEYFISFIAVANNTRRQAKIAPKHLKVVMLFCRLIHSRLTFALTSRRLRFQTRLRGAQRRHEACEAAGQLAFDH